MAPLFLQRVETIYSLAQLSEAPDLRPSPHAASLGAALSDPDLPISDVPSSRLPIYRYVRSHGRFGAGDRGAGDGTSVSAAAAEGRRAPLRRRSLSAVGTRSFGSLTNLEAVLAGRAASQAAREELLHGTGDGQHAGTPDAPADPTFPGEARSSPQCAPSPSVAPAPVPPLPPSSPALANGASPSRPPRPRSSAGFARAASPAAAGSGSSPPPPLGVPAPLALPPLGSRTALDNLILTEWESRARKGLFRYDVRECRTKLLPGSFRFVAQLNPGRLSQKRPSQVRIDAVDQIWDSSKFNFTKARQEELLFAFQGVEEEEDSEEGGDREAEGEEGEDYVEIPDLDEEEQDEEEEGREGGEEGEEQGEIQELNGKCGGGAQKPNGACGGGEMGLKGGWEGGSRGGRAEGPMRRSSGDLSGDPPSRPPSGSSGSSGPNIPDFGDLGPEPADPSARSPSPPPSGPLSPSLASATPFASLSSAPPFPRPRAPVATSLRSSASRDSFASSSRPPRSAPINLVLINVSPIEYGHVLLVPDALSARPQRAERMGVSLAARLSAVVRNPYFKVGFNSLGAYGTVNHLHYQAYYLPSPMPAELAPTVEVDQAWKEYREGRGRAPADAPPAPRLPAGVQMHLVLGYPVRGVVLQLEETERTKVDDADEPCGADGARPQAAAPPLSGSDPCALLGSLVGDAARRLAALGIPHNLFIADAGKRIFLFPNVYSRRKAAGTVPPRLEAMGIDPACWEIAGHIICKRQEDYETMTQEDAWNLLACASLGEDDFFQAISAAFGNGTVAQER